MYDTLTCTRTSERANERASAQPPFVSVSLCAPEIALGTVVVHDAPRTKHKGRLRPCREPRIVTGTCCMADGAARKEHRRRGLGYLQADDIQAGKMRQPHRRATIIAKQRATHESATAVQRSINCLLPRRKQCVNLHMCLSEITS